VNIFAAAAHGLHGFAAHPSMCMRSPGILILVSDYRDYMGLPAPHLPPLLPHKDYRDFRPLNLLLVESEILSEPR
jgi:hypothetical protein